MDGEAWWAAVHGVAKSWTQLSDFTFTFHFHAYPYPSSGEVGALLSLPSNPKQDHISLWEYFCLLLNISKQIRKAMFTQLSGLVTSSPNF